MLIVMVKGMQKGKEIMISMLMRQSLGKNCPQREYTVRTSSSLIKVKFSLVGLKTKIYHKEGQSG